jgi:DNA-binding Lrp family transcriptional regulator
VQKLKSIDYKILAALMKNSKISDRQLAKEIGVSQPTVTRRRARLEKESIDGYTAIPKWKTLGYEMLVITLVRTKSVYQSEKNYEAAREKGIDWLMKQPYVIFGGAIEGSGINSFVMSLHRSYAEYNRFLQKLRIDWGDFIETLQSFIVDLTSEKRIKPLHLKYLADAE